MTDHLTTHAPGCWSWGQRHYECAVGQIERDEAMLARRVLAGDWDDDGAEHAIGEINCFSHSK